MKTGQWSQEEHNSFLRGLIKYNSASQKWKLIAKEFVDFVTWSFGKLASRVSYISFIHIWTTRTRTQTASHSQKYWKRLRIGLKRLSKPKKHKHCVQCSECDQWYTGRYWTEDECWALKDWWICESCEEIDPNKKRRLSEMFDSRASSDESDTEDDSSTTSSSSSSTTSSSSSSSSARSSYKLSPTLSNDNGSQIANSCRVRCICHHDDKKSDDKMAECLNCHNLLHKDCIKENLSSDGLLKSCPNCSVVNMTSKKRASSEESEDVIKSVLPLKKRRIGY